MSAENDLVVCWTLHDDGIRPKESSCGFVIQCPVDITVRPGEEVEFDLNVSADLPLIAYSRKELGDWVRPSRVVFAPGERVRIVIRNASNHIPFTITSMQSALNVTPISFHGKGVLA